MIDATPVRQPDAVLTAGSLPALAYEANEEHRLAVTSGARMVEHAIAAGEALTAAKAQLSHGEWYSWLAENFAASRQTADNYRRLAQNASALAFSDEDDPSIRKALAAIGASPHVSNNSGENEWYTPPHYLEAARRVMGGIDLDPASSDRANELVQATVYFTKDDDGLRRPWSGRVWMNPPYSKDLIWPFCERLCEFYASGDVSEAIVLVNNATETAAFQRMAEIASAMCFHARRIKYLNANLEVAETPLQGQAFLYFGENVEAFRSEFVQFGFTVAA